MHNLTTALKAAAGNAGEETNPNAWDLSKGESAYESSDVWDIETLVIRDNFSVVSQEATPRAMFFKSDGTKMYIAGNSGDDVNEYNLTNGWRVSDASYSQTFSVASQENNIRGIFFKPDGTKMYVTGTQGDDVNEYNLSTAWDVSTASYSQVFSVSTNSPQPNDIFFKSDGTKMYIADSDTTDKVVEYDLSTAWDVSTASYSQYFSVNDQETAIRGLYFRSTGTEMFILGNTKQVHKYSLSTAWDVSTASYNGVDKIVNAGGESSFGALYFKDDGTKLFILGENHDQVDEFSLGEKKFSVTSQETAPTGLAFKSDGTKMFVVGTSGDDINEYNLTTAWDVFTASYSQNFSVSSQTTAPEGVRFKSDGTVMYVGGAATDKIFQYTLTTAWDVSTASYASKSFTVTTQEGSMRGFEITNDGAKLYVVGNGSNDVHEYDLSTAWDISTASFTGNQMSPAGRPRGIFFKSDGTKMYVASSASSVGALSQYDLSTAWDVSTASEVYVFGGTAATGGLQAEPRPHDIFFKPDGTRYYTISQDDDAVYQFDIPSS